MQAVGVEVGHNLVHELGAFEKQSSMVRRGATRPLPVPAVFGGAGSSRCRRGQVFLAKTCAAHIHDNVFFNGPRAGMNFNDGFGGGDLLERNLVFSTCRESGDHGPFNSWDRQPFVTDVRDGTPSTRRTSEDAAPRP